MSISVPLAVTMMIGTAERARIERHTSMPDILGSIRSKRTRSGSSRRRAAGPPGHHGRQYLEAFVAQPHDQGVDERLLILGQKDVEGAGLVGVSGGAGHGRSLRLQRQHQSEGRPFAFPGLHVDPPLVVVGHVANDRKAEPGPAGVTAAAVVDPVEALEDPVEVAGRDADPVIGHR